MIKRLLFSLSIFLLVTGAGLCQPAFDIADVHFSPRSDWSKTVDHWMDGGVLGGDRYRLRRATMIDLISTAYGVDANKVFGGPAWIDYDRYEVVAKTKPGTRPATLRLMLQALLAERFHLVVKTETQQVPGILLTRGKSSLKLETAADAAGASGCKTTPLINNGVMNYVVQCRNVTMEAFAASFSGPSRRIADATGLEGSWDIDMQYALGNLAGGGSGLDAAIEKLGLKMEQGNVPQPVLTVVSVNEQPSANSPAVSTVLAALPAPEFEVASIKLGGEGMTSMPRYEPGGRVVMTGVSPLGLVSQAWNVPSLEQLVGVPKWAMGNNSHNVTIMAKAPTGVATDRENLNLMLRALLTERYKLAVHFEDRPMDAYTLVAVKPKLTKADPSHRTECTRQTEIHPGQGAVIQLDCKNTTMAQFAEQIPAYWVTIRYAVLDGTGIEGAWDFSVHFDTFSMRPGGGATAAADGAASDPTGSISFVDAIQRELGLKLEMHKRPEPVLVIDHMEEYPTEN